MSDTAIETPEEHVARMDRLSADMAAAGVSTEETMQVDYFGFEETARVELPDNRSYVDIKALNEGGRRAYLNAVNKEVRITKGTGDAVMQMANGDERRILLRHAICGWNLVKVRNGSLDPVPFKEGLLSEFLEKANPVVIDVIDKAVRKQNPWLQTDVTLEDLEKQREELDEQIEKKRAEEEGKES
jgi:hypothetical protein